MSTGTPRPTTLVSFADPHWCDRAPSSRRDAFPSTQIRKLEWVIHTINSLASGPHPTPVDALLIAGDLFHQPNGQLIPRSLETALIPTLQGCPCPIYAILGNHDLHNLDPKASRKHPTGVLDAAGIITLLQYPDHRVVGTDVRVLITGRNYTSDSPRAWLRETAATKQLHDLKAHRGSNGTPAHLVCMLHTFFAEQDNPEGCYEETVGTHHLSDTGINLAVYGHSHRIEIHEFANQTTPGSGYAINPGALTRGSIAEQELTRIPQILVSTFTETTATHTLVDVPHEPAATVFKIDAHQAKRARVTTRSSFMNALESMASSNLTFHQRLAEASRPNPAAAERLRQAYLEAEAEINRHHTERQA